MLPMLRYAAADYLRYATLYFRADATPLRYFSYAIYAAMFRHFIPFDATLISRGITPFSLYFCAFCRRLLPFTTLPPAMLIYYALMSCYMSWRNTSSYALRCRAGAIMFDAHVTLTWYSCWRAHAAAQRAEAWRTAWRALLISPAFALLPPPCFAARWARRYVYAR